MIIKFSSLGDIVLSTASLRAIRERFPHHKISFLVGEESKEVLFRCPYIDELLVVDLKNKDGKPVTVTPGFTAVIAKDGTIDLHKSTPTELKSASDAKVINTKKLKIMLGGKEFEIDYMDILFDNVPVME